LADSLGHNSESYPDSYSEDYREGYSPCYLGSYPAGSLENCCRDRSQDCAEDSSGDSLANSPADSPENRLENSWENCLVDCLADCLGDARCRRVNRSDAIRPLPQLDDLGAEAGTGFDDIDAGRECPHVIRAGTQVHHSPPANVRQACCMRFVA
jgi:hypothetical protein